MTLLLSKEEPFARGGNRLCFVHPGHSDRAIKVRRPDYTLSDLRKKKKFPKNLRPLSSFDDNLEEFNVVNRIARTIGDEAFLVISRCYGFEDTDLGSGLVSELIRDGDGKISYSMMEYIWNYGYQDELKEAVARFSERWIRLAIPSRSLLLHNILVQCGKNKKDIRLVVIDGLGSPNLVKVEWLPYSLRRKKAEKKIEDLDQRIEDILVRREKGDLRTAFWKLKHRGDDG